MDDLKDICLGSVVQSLVDGGSGCGVVTDIIYEGPLPFARVMWPDGSIGKIRIIDLLEIEEINEKRKLS